MARAAANRREEIVCGGISDTTLRKFAGYNIKRASNVMQADLVRTLEPFGLRMITFTALMLIVENPDLSQSQLAGVLSIERSNLVTIVDDLEKHGWIVRNPSPHDRRSYALRATEAGERQCAKALQSVRRHEEKLLAGLQADELAALIAALQKIERAKGGA